MKMELPHVRTNAYLDDRPVCAGSCDRCPEPWKLPNRWMIILVSGRRRKLCELIDYTRSLVYLGVDVLMRVPHVASSRVRMKQRVRAVGVRSELMFDDESSPTLTAWHPCC